MESCFRRGSKPARKLVERFCQGRYLYLPRELRVCGPALKLWCRADGPAISGTDQWIFPFPVHTFLATPVVLFSFLGRDKKVTNHSSERRRHHVRRCRNILPIHQSSKLRPPEQHFLTALLSSIVGLHITISFSYLPPSTLLSTSRDAANLSQSRTWAR